MSPTLLMHHSFMHHSFHVSQGMPVNQSCQSFICIQLTPPPPPPHKADVGPMTVPCLHHRMRAPSSPGDAHSIMHAALQGHDLLAAHARAMLGAPACAQARRPPMQALAPGGGAQREA